MGYVGFVKLQCTLSEDKVQCQATKGSFWQAGGLIAAVEEGGERRRGGIRDVNQGSRFDTLETKRHQRRPGLKAIEEEISVSSKGVEASRVQDLYVYIVSTQ
ncbi:hypothetical protein OPV22_017752 [Ensete ventricosum]|uniref:Uncharacterized protein n=1 Tax=Ensete ventricosum TaxID=4639 RepID=A0AAV8QSS2_ENSVE|nr:hypothetical protein OPV22_017752 [Ensete ventricosum]RWV84834.1 hypothetical protein GW17_00053422 [Ensete ventricosum]